MNFIACTAEQYRIFEDNPELRRTSNILDNNEVRNQVMTKIAEIPTSIQVRNTILIF